MVLLYDTGSIVAPWRLTGDQAAVGRLANTEVHWYCSLDGKPLSDPPSQNLRRLLKSVLNSVKGRFGSPQNVTQPRDTSHVANLKDVENWLTQMYAEDPYPPHGIPLREFQSRFLYDTKLQLDFAALGTTTFRKLLNQFPHLVRVKTTNIPGQTADVSNVFRSRTVMSGKVKEDMLLEACKQRGVTSSPLSATSPTSVWWDIENCGIPKGTDAAHVAGSIRQFLLNHRIECHVSIQAFGYMPLLPTEVKESLAASGTILHSVPTVSKDAGDRALLESLLSWAASHPPPARIMLISGDHYFSNALSTLHSLGYSVMLAYPQNASRKLRKISPLAFPWPSIAGGTGTQSADTTFITNDHPCACQGHVAAGGNNSDASREENEVVNPLVPEVLNPRGRERGSESSSSNQANPVQVATVEAIRDWVGRRVPSFISPKEGLPIEDYKFLFEAETCQRVDPSAFGYKNLSRLFAQFPDLVRVEKYPGQTRIFPSSDIRNREQGEKKRFGDTRVLISRRGDEGAEENLIDFDNQRMAADLFVLLGILVDEAGNQACLVSCVSSRFFCKYGYHLDHHRLGHRSVASLLKALPNIVVVKPSNIYFTRPTTLNEYALCT